MTDAIDRVPLSTSVYRKLRNAILVGDLPVGSELNQVALAKQFGVSTIPVREAFRMLQADGLIVSEPFQRAHVRGLTKDELIEMFALWEELEVVGIRLHGVQLDDATCDELEAINAELAATSDNEEWLAVDRKFHRVLHGGTTVTGDIVDVLRRRIRSGVIALIQEVHPRSEAVPEHALVLEALRRGDASDAEAGMRAHIHTTCEFLLDHYEASAAERTSATRS